MLTLTEGYLITIDGYIRNSGYKKEEKKSYKEVRKQLHKKVSTS